VSGLKSTPFPPLVQGGDGLDYGPEPRPAALVSRMADVYGVPPETIFPVRGAGHGMKSIMEVLGEQFPITDESWIEIGDLPSEAASVVSATGRALIRDLTVYGLAGAPCGAVIAHPSHIDQLRLAQVFWDWLPIPVVRLAESVLAPSRVAAYRARFAAWRAELGRLADVPGLIRDRGPWVRLVNPDRAALARWGITLPESGRGSPKLMIGDPDLTDRLLAALGIPVSHRVPARRAEICRDTKETRIVATVDLDRADPVNIHTGIGFYDHMLEQIARHGGFSLTLAAEGDLHIEAHHTIEDTALALGEALRQALGDRKGVARFGFVAPLDEAEAAVTLDLSGRPLAKWEGTFARPMIGEYPTEMTAHVFRSLADAMRATIHVKVTGEDDHHKTEAAFKSFGRALRQAIRVEGDAIPSTKGVLA